MSEGDWRKHLTLGLTVALAAVWIWPVIWSLVPPLEYDPAQYPTEIAREEARKEQDTYAQIWAAWAGWWQAFIGVAGLVGLGLTVRVASLAWHEAKRGADAGWYAAEQAKRQADIAQRQLEDSRIPELFVDVPDGGIRIADNSASPSVIVRITNIGPTLAVITGGMVRLSYEQDVLDIPYLGTVEFLTPRPKLVTVNSHPMPPGGPPFAVSVACTQEEVIANRPHIGNDGTVSLSFEGPTFFVTGWVEYRNQWRDKFTQAFQFFYSASGIPVRERFTELDVVYEVEPGTNEKLIRSTLTQDDPPSA